MHTDLQASSPLESLFQNVLALREFEPVESADTQEELNLDARPLLARSQASVEWSCTQKTFFATPELESSTDTTPTYTPSHTPSQTPRSPRSLAGSPVLRQGPLRTSTSSTVRDPPLPSHIAPTQLEPQSTVVEPWEGELGPSTSGLWLQRQPTRRRPSTSTAGVGARSGRRPVSAGAALGVAGPSHSHAYAVKRRSRLSSWPPMTNSNPSTPADEPTELVYELAAQELTKPAFAQEKEIGRKERRAQSEDEEAPTKKSSFESCTDTLVSRAHPRVQSEDTLVSPTYDSGYRPRQLHTHTTTRYSSPRKSSTAVPSSTTATPDVKRSRTMMASRRASISMAGRRMSKWVSTRINIGKTA